MNVPRLTTLGLILGLTLPASAEDWGRFRGPNGTGISEAKSIPTQFEDSSYLWKTEIPGTGNSSPVSAKGKVFLQSSSPDQTHRSLSCVDLATGTIDWTKDVPGGKVKIHAKNSAASSTPATDGERIYAIFWDGSAVALHAFDFAGKALWMAPLGAFASQHGVGMSPIVVDDMVIVNFDMDERATVLAFETKTGKEVYRIPRTAYRASYSTPFLTEGKGGRELIVASTAGVSGYEPKTGKELWTWTWKFAGAPLRMVSSPIAHNGMIFATTGDGGGDRNMVGIRDRGQGDVTKANLVWEIASDKKDKAKVGSRAATAYVPTMLAKGDHLYWVTDIGLATCVEAKTGKLMWSERLGSSGVSASPIMIDGKILALTEDGTAYFFKADPAKYSLVGKSKLGEATFASPAVADGKLLIRTKTQLLCIGSKPQ